MTSQDLVNALSLLGLLVLGLGLCAIPFAYEADVRAMRLNSQLWHELRAGDWYRMEPRHALVEVLEAIARDIDPTTFRARERP